MWRMWSCGVCGHVEYVVMWSMWSCGVCSDSSRPLVIMRVQDINHRHMAIIVIRVVS